MDALCGDSPSHQFCEWCTEVIHPKFASLPAFREDYDLYSSMSKILCLIMFGNFRVPKMMFEYVQKTSSKYVYFACIFIFFHILISHFTFCFDVFLLFT